VILIRFCSQENVLILSPLAGITIPPFRRLCAEYGAITVSEMTFARGISSQNPKSLRRIQRAENEKKYGIQLLTNNEKDLEGAINYIENEEGLCDFIELNLGCPKPKIVAANLGSALLKSSNLTLLKALFELGNSFTIPFGIKMRAGYEKANFIEVLKIADQNNLSFVTFHARLAVDTYAQPVRTNYWIKAARESSIPIIINGDIKTQSQVKRLIGDFGSQNIIGAAIGRAARGNPQVFYNGTTPVQLIEVYDKLIKYMKENSYFNSINVKIHSADFLKRFRYAATIRKKIISLKNPSLIVNLTRKYILDSLYCSIAS
jgi:tRNA-dihydrouridine synthase B